MADREFIDLIFDPDTLRLGFDTRVFPERLHEEPFEANRPCGDSGDIAAIPPLMRPAGYGHGWFRTSDLSRVKRALSH
jgi:hypothetical protein